MNNKTNIQTCAEVNENIQSDSVSHSISAGRYRILSRSLPGRHSLVIHWRFQTCFSGWSYWFHIGPHPTEQPLSN